MRRRAGAFVLGAAGLEEEDVVPRHVQKATLGSLSEGRFGGLNSGSWITKGVRKQVISPSSTLNLHPRHFRIQVVSAQLCP